MNDYVLIGVLVFIIVILLALVVYLIFKMSFTNTEWNKRLLTSDRHHTAKERFLTFLLLESKGINTGVGATSKLYKEYVKELVKDDTLDRFEEFELVQDPSNDTEE